MLSWFVVRAQYAQEERAQQHLQRQDYQTLLPLARTESRRADGLLVARTRPLFGCYMFVGVEEDQRWQPIASTTGVTSFVGWFPGMACPPKVDHRDMHELRTRIHEAGGIFQLGLTRPQDIRPGLLVRILFGPFRDQSALVQTDCGSRVEVLLRYAGAMSRLRLPKELLTAA